MDSSSYTDAVAGPDQIDLSWSLSSATTPDAVSYYTIYDSLNGGSYSKYATNVSGTSATSYAITGLPAGSYTFELTAKDTYGQVSALSAASGPVAQQQVATHVQEVGADSIGSDGTLTIPVTSATKAGDTVLVAVGTWNSATTSVKDSAGNTYSLVSSGSGGAYLYGSKTTSSIPAGGTITVTVSGTQFGASAVAQEWSNLTLTVDPTGSQSGYEKTPGVSGSYPDAGTGEEFFLVAGGGTSNSGNTISPSYMSLDQATGGVSTVVGYGALMPGASSVNYSFSWAPTYEERSWLVVALQAG